MKKTKGFTLIEVLIGIAIIAILSAFVVGIPTIIKGNVYWTGTGVVEQLQEDHPGVTKIIRSKSERNIFAYSVIVVEENGQRSSYHLDTDIFFDYEFLTPEQVENE